MEWYYAANGERIGPLSEEAFKDLVSSCTVNAETMVWHAGMANWEAHGKIQPGAYDSKPTVAVRTNPVMAGTVVQAGGMPSGSADVGKENSGLTGNTPNGELTAMARASLSGSWGIAIGIGILYMLVYMGASMLPFQIGVLLVIGPLTVGLAACFLSIARGTKPEVSLLFSGFQNFLTCFVAYLLMSLFIFLWSLLLIIPGIIAAYAYSQLFYILADNPSLSAMEALKLSKEMMKGRKWKLFCLYLRFLGWSILCLFTLGIGYIWLTPYINTSMAHFYRDVSQR